MTSQTILTYLAEQCRRGPDLAIRPDQVRRLNRLLSQALQYPGRTFPPRKKTKTLDNERHRLLKSVAGVSSSKDLTVGQYYALVEFLIGGDAVEDRLLQQSLLDLQKVVEGWYNPLEQMCEEPILTVLSEFPDEKQKPFLEWLEEIDWPEPHLTQPKTITKST